MVVLPPPAALRAFEAAARHGSFTAAAVELNATPSAVSHQLRHLEDLWALPLFTRGRRLRLTPAGEQLAAVVRQFLAALEGTLAAVRAPDRAEPLRVSLTQSFAAKWFLPRLPAFSAAHPTVNVWISTTDEAVRFEVGGIDVAIRLGTAPGAGLHAVELLREYIFPVGSPVLLERHGPVATPADLLRFPLILRSGKRSVPRWEYWFERVGVARVAIPDGPRLPDTAMTVDAALAGHGVALIRSAHVTDELCSGRLIKLVDMPVRSPISYFLVCPSGHETRPAIAALEAWLIEQARAAQQSYDERDGGTRPARGSVNDRSTLG